MTYRTLHGRSSGDGSSVYEDPVLFLDTATRLAQRTISLLFSRMGDKIGVNRSQMRLLYLLHQNEGMTQRDISRKLALHDPGITVALSALEAMGFVRRMPDLHGGRRVLVHLALDMKAQMDEIAGEIEEMQRQAEQCRSTLAQLLILPAGETIPQNMQQS